jgi:hypothetical protein
LPASDRADKGSILHVSRTLMLAGMEKWSLTVMEIPKCKLYCGCDSGRSVLCLAREPDSLAACSSESQSLEHAKLPSLIFPGSLAF